MDELALEKKKVEESEYVNIVWVELSEGEKKALESDTYESNY